MTTSQNADASFIATRLTDAQKRETLLKLTEDEFRDQVVRPLYRRMGLPHLRELHGPDEQGKDCMFQTSDPMGDPMLIGVQTKCGPVNMAGTTPSSNMVTIETQLKMGLAAFVPLENQGAKLRPSQMHLCASGKISNSARDYLLQKCDAHCIKIYGADELIERIDKHFPEYWLGIDADTFPYVRALRQRLCNADDVIRMLPEASEPGADSPLHDQNYLHLRLTRLDEEVTHRVTQVPAGRSKITRSERHVSPKFVDIAVENLVEQRTTLSFIAGEGGSGKTTAIRRIALQLIDKVLADASDARIPVIVKAKQVANTSSNLLELLAQEVSALSSGKSPFSVVDLSRGRVAVLVDALEEVDADDRAAAVERILDFHGSYPLCPVVVTARDYRSVLDALPPGHFTQYYILPVGLAEMDALIERVQQRKSIDENVVRSTLKRLNQQHGLILSPMLVTLFLASSDFTQQDLPPNIAEVFRKFTEQMIGRWDEKKGLRQQYEANTKDFLLRRLAFHMHAKRVRSIRYSDAMSLVDTELQRRGLDIDLSRIADELFTRSCLFRFDGDQIEWRHHLLQEYFAGRGVPSASFFEAVAADDWWRTPMVFYFGNSPEAFDALWTIVQASESLSLSQLFDAATTIGLATQACYLADISQKSRALAWVVHAFATSMDEFRRVLDTREGGDRGMMSLCALVGFGREAIGTRSLVHVAESSFEGSELAQALIQPVDRDRVRAWRIIGLLEANELEKAEQLLHEFRPTDRVLVFMMYLSVAWAIYSKKPSSEVRKKLERYIAYADPVVDDMKKQLHQELKSLFFQMEKGKVIAVGTQGAKKVDANPSVGDSATGFAAE